MVSKGFQSKISWVSHGFHRSFDAEFFSEVFVRVESSAKKTVLNNIDFMFMNEIYQINICQTILNPQIITWCDYHKHLLSNI